MEAIIGLLAALVTGVSVFVGTRYTANKTSDGLRAQLDVERKRVTQEQRKVDQEAFDRFVQRYEADRVRQEEVISETRNILHASLRHVTLLRSEMRSAGMVPPPLPEELQDLPWDLIDGEYN